MEYQMINKLTTIRASRKKIIYNSNYIDINMLQLISSFCIFLSMSDIHLLVLIPFIWKFTTLVENI